MAEYHLGVNMTKLERQRKSKLKYELAIFLSIPLFLQGAFPAANALSPAHRRPVAPMAVNLATAVILWPMKPFIQWCVHINGFSTSSMSAHAPPQVLLLEKQLMRWLALLVAARARPVFCTCTPCHLSLTMYTIVPTRTRLLTPQHILDIT